MIFQSVCSLKLGIAVLHHLALGKFGLSGASQMKVYTSEYQDDVSSYGAARHGQNDGAQGLLDRSRHRRRYDPQLPVNLIDTFTRSLRPPWTQSSGIGRRTGCSWPQWPPSDAQRRGNIARVGSGSGVLSGCYELGVVGAGSRSYIVYLDTRVSLLKTKK